MSILRIRDDKGNITDIPAIKGDAGKNGIDGVGIAMHQILYDGETGKPTKVILSLTNGDLVTIPIVHGEKGEAFTYEDFTAEQLAALKGANGISCTHSWNGTTLTVTSASGTSSADLKGNKGDSYILTDADKQEIANIVADMLPDLEEVSY